MTTTQETIRAIARLPAALRELRDRPGPIRKGEFADLVRRLLRHYPSGPWELRHAVKDDHSLQDWQDELDEKWKRLAPTNRAKRCVTKKQKTDSAP